MQDITATHGQVVVRIKGFETRYTTGADGETKGHDWVSYYPLNQAQTTLISKPMAHITDILPLDDPQNSILVFAHQRKNAILPAYEAWKQGHEMPESGTPLESWSQLQKTEITIIRHAGIRTIEELANALDSTIGMVKLPNPRDYRTRAQRFLASKDANVAATQLNQAMAENADLKETLAEMQKEMLAWRNERALEKAAEAKTADAAADVAEKRRRRLEARNKPVEPIVNDTQKDDQKDHQFDDETNEQEAA